MGIVMADLGRSVSDVDAILAYSMQQTNHRSLPIVLCLLTVYSVAMVKVRFIPSEARF